MKLRIVEKYYVTKAGKEKVQSRTLEYFDGGASWGGWWPVEVLKQEVPSVDFSEEGNL